MGVIINILPPFDARGLQSHVKQGICRGDWVPRIEWPGAGPVTVVCGEDLFHFSLALVDLALRFHGTDIEATLLGPPPPYHTHKSFSIIVNCHSHKSTCTDYIRGTELGDSGPKHILI